MPSRQIVLVLLLVAVAAAGMWVWRLSTNEPMAGFRDFPWTYITETSMGTDAAKVLIDRGTVAGPSSIKDAATGQMAWPAHFHPDPAVVPWIDGKPVIFPVIPNGPGSRTPLIPSLKRPLTQQELVGVQRYFTPEGAERMEAFRKEMER